MSSKFVVKNGLIAAGLSYPTSDGTSGYVLTTNGAGVLSWAAQTGGGGGSGATSLTGDVTGTISGSAINTALATVNSNVGTFQGLTINGKGLVTAAVNQNYIPNGSSVSLGTLASNVQVTSTNGSGFGTGPTIAAVGAGTDIALNLTTKGSGNLNVTCNSAQFSGPINIAGASQTLAAIVMSIPSANAVAIRAQALGTYPTIDMSGSNDTNCGLNIITKGTGTLQVNGVPVSTGGGGGATSLTGDVTGTISGSAIATQLATVNSNVGTFNTFTVNAKGLITAASTVDNIVNGSSVVIGNAANYVTVVGSTAGVGGVALLASGNDTNLDLYLNAQGTGVVRTFSSHVIDGTSLIGNSVANKMTLAGKATGIYPTITVTGADADIGLNIITKGAGTLQVNGVAVTGGGGGGSSSPSPLMYYFRGAT